VDAIRGMIKEQLASVQDGDEPEPELFGAATELCFPSSVFDLADSAIEGIGSLLDVDD
jgi:hypothetical protein